MTKHSAIDTALSAPATRQLPAFKITLMGQFAVELGGLPIHLNSRAAQTMFAYLALHANKPIRREKLAGVFWPDLPEGNARNQLRHAIWHIRGSLSGLGCSGVAFIPDDSLHVRLCLSPDSSLDVAGLLRPIAAPTLDVACDDLIAQLAGYDELLPGFHSPRDEWICEWRYRLEHTYVCKAVLLIDRLVEEGRCTEALFWASRLPFVGPFMEPLQQKLAQAIETLTDQWRARPPNSAHHSAPNAIPSKPDRPRAHRPSTNAVTGTVPGANINATRPT